MPVTSEAADDPLGTVAANEDVEGNEEEEKEEEEEVDDDPEVMDEDEYLAKVINKGGEVRKFQAGLPEPSGSLMFFCCRLSWRRRINPETWC